jgi:hypothetical protein
VILLDKNHTPSFHPLSTDCFIKLLLKRLIFVLSGITLTFDFKTLSGG